jgi:hypothetical protein
MIYESATATLYLSFGEDGGIYRGRPNNEQNSGPLVREISGTTATLWQAAGTNNPASTGTAFIVMVVGSNGGILKSSRSGNYCGTWTNVHTASQPLKALATNASGTWVAAGANDLVCVSTNNGTSWTETTTGHSGTWNWMAYGNGKFVVVGDLGLIAYSTNGTDWTKLTSDAVTDLNSIAYSPTLNKFSAVGDGGVIVMSEG